MDFMDDVNLVQCEWSKSNPVAQRKPRMAWEQRRSQFYFYRVCRVNGRVVRKYLGRGPAAVAAAEGMAARRAKRATEYERRQADLVLVNQLLTLGTSVDAAVSEALQAAGYHRPNRKSWRKRRATRN